MKPIIFDYAKMQENKDFPKLIYNRNIGMNFVDNQKFVDICNSSSILQTKTFTQRESDDESKRHNSNLAVSYFATKTDTIREGDDESQINQNLIYLLTKTEQKREEDE